MSSYRGFLKIFGKKNKDLPPKNNTGETEWTERDVLVGVLRDKNQLDVCLAHKFYHIPSKYISKRHLPIKYVAIYQSKNLFGKEAKLQYVGRVVRCYTIKRNELKQIPKKSKETYYRFDVASWEKLDYPIQPKEVGFVRIFTNYDMMLHSREIPELMLSGKREHTLYNCIKDAIKKAQSDREGSTMVFAWDDFGFGVDIDDIHLLKDGDLINMYSVYEFLDMPLTILGQIRRDMNRAL